MRKIYMLLCYMAIALASCDKDTEPFNFAPQLAVDEATDIYRFGATLSGSIHQKENSRIEECGIMYSLYPNMESAQTATVEVTTEGGFTVNLTGLKAGQEYFYCTYASSGYSTVRSEIRSFITLSTGGPVFGACTQGNITATSVEVSTTLVDNGGTELSEFGYVYKQVAGETDRDFKIGDKGVSYAKSEGTGYRMTISDLEPGKMYGIRPYGKSSAEGYGNAVFVTTEKTSTPALSSCTLSNATETTATVTARILSAGTSAVTERGFFYSAENRNPTEAHRTVKVEGTTDEMTAVLSGLQPKQTYYIRAYARNSSGYGYGEVLEYLVKEVSAPTVSTVSVTDVTETSAKVTGAISSDGNAPITSKGFCWSATNAQPTIADSKHEVNGDGSSFATVITGLMPGRKYYVRFYAENSKGITYGDVLEFTTLSTAMPIVETSGVTEVTETSARVSGVFTQEEGGAIGSKGFCWSTTNTLPTVNDSRHEVNGEGSAFATVLTGLTPGQKYYVRFYVEFESLGYVYGNALEFTTAKTTAPVLAGTTVSSITKTSARAVSTITSDGGANVTERGFCISSTNAMPTTGDRKVAVSGASEVLDIVIDGLTEGTTYHVRSYAVNRNGTSYGEVTTFTTLQTAIPDISGVWYCIDEGDTPAQEYTLTLNKDGSIQRGGTGYTFVSGTWNVSKDGTFTARGYVIATQTHTSWDRYSGNVDNMDNPTKITGLKYSGNVNQVANVEDVDGSFTMSRTSSKATPSEGDLSFPKTE